MGVDDLLCIWLVVFHALSRLVLFLGFVVFFVFDIYKYGLAVTGLTHLTHIRSLPLLQSLLLLSFFLSLLHPPLAFNTVHFHLPGNVSWVYLFWRKIRISLLNILYVNFIGEPYVKSCSLK